jgi:phospholipase C
MQSLWKALSFLFLAITGPALAASPPEHRPELDRIGHIIVLFLENRSFDHLYGLFPFGICLHPGQCRRPSVRNVAGRHQQSGAAGRDRLTLRRRTAERTIPCRPIY